MFTEDGKHILLEYPQKASLTCAMTGEFVDRQKWLESPVARGEALLLRGRLREAGSSPSPELLDRLLAGLDVALKATRPDDPRGKAYVMRLQGECLDARGDRGCALEHSIQL